LTSFHLHHLLKPPRLAGKPGDADALNEVFIKRTRLLRRRCSVERRPLAAPDIAVEGELGNHQQFAAGFAHRSIHLATIVFENSQPNDLV